MVPYAAVLLDDGERLMLGRQYGGYPCPPGGRIEDGESPRGAAVRELLEEAGVVVRPHELVLLDVVDHLGKTNAVTHRGHWYVARAWSGEPVNVEPAKCEGWLWYPYDDLPLGMDDHTAAVVAGYLERRRYASS